VSVGICVERSLEMLTGLLGILKAGGAYVPLDPTYPQERLAFMVADSRVRVLLTQQALLVALPVHQAQVICLDTDWEAIAYASCTSPGCEVRPEQVAYVLYTSGSTGQPKGVQVRHRGVVNFLLSMVQQPGLTVQDVLLSVTTLSFDIAVLELFVPLLVGARVILVSRALAADGLQLGQALARYAATLMQATPATWRLLLDSGWQGSDRLTILCGGAPGADTHEQGAA
jgi:non-ribosomal peptide synthetase component F